MKRITILICVIVILGCAQQVKIIQRKCISGDCSNGVGAYMWVNGVKYEGEWKDGKAHGQGTMIFPDGSKYEGEWRDGIAHGQGIMTLPNGTKYKVKNGELIH